MTMTGVIYRLGGFTLDLVCGVLLRENGKEVPLRAKSFMLLRLLVENAGRLLDRETINRAIWPDVTVTDESMAQCVRDVRRALGDEGQTMVKTVPRRGYRFAAEVTTLPREAPAAPDPPAVPPHDRPSIAVLALANMSGDQEQEYFADGMAEDIITALTHVRWLLVIARSSSFIYKGRAADLKQIGRELGVRYVLEGSVRRSGGRLRVTARLTEAESGAQIWADRYNRTMDDIFDVQDELTQAVVAAIEPAMASVERDRAVKASGNLGAWELYHRGLWYFYKFTAPDGQRAIETLEAARALDPGNASIHAALAHVCYHHAWQFVPREDEILMRRAIEHGRTAIALDPLNAIAHAAYGCAAVLLGQHALGVREAGQAVALNANNAYIQGINGGVLTYSGYPAESISYSRRALRLSPVDPFRFIWFHYCCTAFFLMGDHESCLTSGQALHRLQPDLLHGYRAAMLALVGLGRMAEANEYTDIIYSRFNRQMTAFLATRYPEFRQQDHDALCAALARGGLVLRDGELLRIRAGG